MFLELLVEYGMFLAKVATFLIAILIVIGAIVNATQKDKISESGSLKIRKINDSLKFMESSIRDTIMDPHARKAQLDDEKKEAKQKDKAAKKNAKKTDSSQPGDDKSDKKVFVLGFDGDIKASAVENLRREITAVLTIASRDDEIVVCLESPGGMVHAYGLAASQLERIRSAGIPLTICVDKVAASGGYMMACIGNKIIAAPFAILGSIGVVASIPNFHRVLKKNDVDYELFTAGEYKRTLTMFGENTDKAREKFNQDLEDTHTLFKNFVSDYRPQLNLIEVATGETWYGKDALQRQLIDELSTSDSYIAGLAKESDVYEVKYEEKQSWQDKLGLAAQGAMQNTIDRLIGEDLANWNRRQ